MSSRPLTCAVSSTAICSRFEQPDTSTEPKPVAPVATNEVRPSSPARSMEPTPVFEMSTRESDGVFGSTTDASCGLPGHERASRRCASDRSTKVWRPDSMLTRARFGNTAPRPPTRSASVMARSVSASASSGEMTPSPSPSAAATDARTPASGNVDSSMATLDGRAST